jgi:uncharacterized protein YggE
MSWVALNIVEKRTRRYHMRKGLLLLAGLVALALVGCQSEGNAAYQGDQDSLASEDARAALAGDSLQQTGVWVTGTGKVSVVPDVAVLRLGVEAEAATVAEAQSDAADTMTDVIAALTANGVAEKDIQTQSYSIYPVRKWDDESREQITLGYRVANMVTAKVRNVDTAGLVIDAVATAGGDLTRVDSISFTVDDPTEYYEEAREEAVLDAMAKAGQLATVAGVTLGGPTYISETGSPVPPQYYVRDFAESAGAPTPIIPGELEISISVQMGFAIQ